MKILNITKLFHLILKLFQNIRYMLIELLSIDRKIGIVVCMLVWKSSLKHVRQIFAVKVARGGGITKQVFSAQQQSNQDEFVNVFQLSKCTRHWCAASRLLSGKISTE